jgi:hypothetical protein
MPKPCLVIGDCSGRVANWNIPDVSLLSSGTSERVEGFHNLIRTTTDADAYEFKSCYVMYFSEVTNDEYAYCFKRFGLGQVFFVEPHIDYFGVLKNREPLVTVDLIEKKQGKVMFLANVCGVEFYDHNYYDIQGLNRFDMSHFSRLIGCEPNSASPLMCVYYSGPPLHEKDYPEHEMYNSGMPLWKTDDMVLQSQSFLVAEKMDGQMRLLTLKRGQIVIRTLEGTPIYRGKWINNTDILIGQVEEMHRDVGYKMFVLTDVSDSDRGTGGFMHRWAKAYDIRHDLIPHGIHLQQWYLPGMIRQVYDDSEEGVVVQRMFSPPGKLMISGLDYTVGTARYIKKVPTVDIEYAGKIIEVVAKDYSLGNIVKVRDRPEKQVPNSLAQIAIVCSGYTIDDAIRIMNQPINQIYVQRRGSGLVYGTKEKEGMIITPTPRFSAYDYAKCVRAVKRKATQKAKRYQWLRFIKDISMARTKKYVVRYGPATARMKIHDGLVK